MAASISNCIRGLRGRTLRLFVHLGHLRQILLDLLQLRAEAKANEVTVFWIRFGDTFCSLPVGISALLQQDARAWTMQTSSSRHCRAHSAG